MSKIFFDTNILIYSVDAANKGKHDRARDLLAEYTRINGGVISTQVVQEYYVVMAGKLKIKPHLVKELIKQLDYQIVDVSFDIIIQAIDIQVDYQISFWDSLIVSSAITAGCHKILTEDLNHHQRIRSILIENPFK